MESGPDYHNYVTTMSGCVMGSADKSKQVGSVEVLDDHLTSLEDVCERLEHRLAPVRSQYATAEALLSEPRAEPANAIRGRIERLSSNVSRLNRLVEEIDL